MFDIKERAKGFIHNKPAQRTLLLYSLIVLIFFGTFLKPDYATDTYAYALGDFSGIVHNFLRCGRIFTAGAYTILRLTGISITLVNLACCVAAISCLIVSLYILNRLTQKFVHNQFWSFILPIIIIINPFIIEFFLFIEKGVMCLSILLCVISAYCYDIFLQKNRRADLVKIIILNIIATFLYQGAIGLFIILATLITVIRSKEWKKFLHATLLSVGFYAIGPLLNLVVVKLFFADGRTGGGLHIIEAGKKVLSGISGMFRFFDVIPPYIFWGFLGISVIIWLIYLIRSRKFSVLDCSKILYLAAVIFFAAIVPQLALAPSSVWIAPRAIYPFGSILGIILILILNSAPKLTYFSLWQKPVVVLSLCYIIIQFIGMNNITLDHYSLAEIDRLRAEEVGRIINNYEQANQIEIKNIAPSYDSNQTYSYKGIKTIADSNISAFSTDWSDVTSINYWNGRSFSRQDPTSDWREYCASQDWDALDNAQFKFTGDTLQICWY